MRRQAGAQELLDGPLDAPSLEGNLRDLARVNRWLGGASLSWRALEPLLPRSPTDRPFRMLDLGTGAGDIPIALAERAERAGLKVEMVATDVRTEIVQIAAARVARAGVRQVEVRLGPQDRIDMGDQSFDIVHASLVLHHLEPSDAQRLLTEMARVASRAVIVNDLDRAKRWLLAARLLTAVATRNRYTRHDGPLSVLRAYRPNELVRLAARAGLVEEARYWARPGYRFAITFRHGEPQMGDTFETEVAIVGGGPAGSALQIRLAGAEIESVLFERAAEPRWRACGVFSSPLTRGHLRELGMGDAELQALARPIPALNLRTQAGATCRLEYSTVAGHACGFDRVALDTALLSRARAAGGVVRRAAVVRSMTLSGSIDRRARLAVSRTDSGGAAEEWRARLVVGADGPRSLVARAAGVSTTPRWLRKAGLTFHEQEPGAGKTERPADGAFHFGRGWYVGAAPVPGGRVNIGIVVPAAELGRSVDEIVERTRGVMRSRNGLTTPASITDEVAVALPLRHTVERVSGSGFLLVGDACGFVDPLTGEGIHRALVSSELAAAAIGKWSRGDAGALEVYDRRLRARFRTKDVVSWVLQVFLSRPALLDYAVRRLARRDRLRDTLTLVLTDHVPASRALDPRYLARLLAP